MQLKLIQSDPRHYQLAVLTTLIVCGIALLGFPIRVVDAFVIMMAAQVTQFLCSQFVGQRFDFKSAVITALSLTLLLRSNEITWLAVAAVIAISSKFLLRINGKHVFNPANSAIISLILLSDEVWVSTGQWGNTVIAAFALACCGFLVLTRAKRAETTLAFLGCYTLMLFARAIWLGDPLAIPVHQMQNGALLIFAFFMISDPKTAPDAAMGRILYGVIVATTGFIIQFTYYKPYGPLLALFCCAPLVPIIDFLLRGSRYRWTTVAAAPEPLPKEIHHETTDTAAHGGSHIFN